MSVTTANKAFWNELCGSALARNVGVTDDSPASLEKFDRCYFAFYPYLERHIPFADLVGREVLEVGLGYGSVAQRLAECGASYTGLDVAAGPVAIVNHRLRQAGLEGAARQGSVLEAPFDDSRFDFVVAIGCYHHTGDLGRALEETWRVLKPGGSAMVMVYNAYSYRRWARWPKETLAYLRWDLLGKGTPPVASAAERAAYDANAEGEPAPETTFVSRRHLRRLAHRFSDFRARLENVGAEGFLKSFDRDVLCRGFGRFLGLDIYCRLTK